MKDSVFTEKWEETILITKETNGKPSKFLVTAAIVHHESGMMKVSLQSHRQHRVLKEHAHTHTHKIISAESVWKQNQVYNEDHGKKQNSIDFSR